MLLVETRVLGFVKLLQGYHKTKALKTVTAQVGPFWWSSSYFSVTKGNLSSSIMTQNMEIRVIEWEFANQDKANYTDIVLLVPQVYR